MNLQHQLKSAEEALTAVHQATTPREMVLHIDEAIRQLATMSAQLGDAYPLQVTQLRALQRTRNV